jgi:hypothetical protein
MAVVAVWRKLSSFSVVVEMAVPSWEGDVEAAIVDYVDYLFV